LNPRVLSTVAVPFISSFVPVRWLNNLECSEFGVMVALSGSLVGAFNSKTWLSSPMARCLGYRM